MENITEIQRESLERLQERVPDLEVRWSDERGVATVLDGELLAWDQLGEPEDIVPRILDEFGVLLGPPGVMENHRQTEVRSDKEGSGYRARAYQVFDDLPVYGATLLVFADEERGVHRIQSSLWRDVEVTAEQRVNEQRLQDLMYERLHEDPDASDFEEAWRQQDPEEWARDLFPLAAYPTFYLYRVDEGFHPAYNALAYQSAEVLGIAGQREREIGQVQLIVDASNGDVLLEESTKLAIDYIDHTGDGLSTLQDSSGNHLSRTLNVVRKDGGNYYYYLWNRLHSPHIRTTDAGGTKPGLEGKLKNDVYLSQDTSGHWDTTETSCTTNKRRDSQQPEVDGHFYAEQAWQFYHGLGWDGFDDGRYGAHCPVRVAAHTETQEINAYFSYYTMLMPTTGKTKYYGYIHFYDGYCDGTTLKFDFLAGDPTVFAHEYQHAVTFFGAKTSTGEPGHLGLSGWPRAIHEGYSDAFAGLRQGQWITPLFWRDGIIRKGSSFTYKGSKAYCQPWRRIEYPRSTETFRGNNFCDHYDDHPINPDPRYYASTLLSHLAFLVGQGGVHQRVSRGDAGLIPVEGIGLYRAAQIFHKALTDYFDTLDTTLSGEMMIEAGELLLKAAYEVAGKTDRKCEYVMMRRALYAMGLYPYDGSHNKKTYGGEACMLPWTFSWRFSQPYLGKPPLWWQSLDLFINNNGSREYNAIVDEENKVFARVRNIGDQDLKNVKVKFYFHPIGTNLPDSIAQWHPCQDKNKKDCVLSITTLEAGSMNFTDADNPPASQARNWFLDSSYVTPQVDHFCLRAVIECEAANHNNDCLNQVQSNIQFEQPAAGASFGISFEASNWLPDPIPLDLDVTHTLPSDYKVSYVGDIPLQRIVLTQNEPHVISHKVAPPERRIDRLEPPYNGKVVADLTGEITGRFTGQLADAHSEEEPPIGTIRDKVEVAGMLAGSADTSEGPATLNGEFSGKLNIKTGVVRGELTANLALAKGRYMDGIHFRVEGCLDPLRTVQFTQFVDGEAVGGVSVQVKFPRLPGQCTARE